MSGNRNLQESLFVLQEIRNIPPILDRRQWNALLDHGLEKPCSYIIRKNPSDSKIIEAINGTTGKIDYSGTNASTVIQSAINAGGQTMLTTGTYIVNNTICLTDTAQCLVGNGKSTILQLADGADCNVINITGTAKWFQEVRNLKIDGNKDQQTKGNGIYISHTYGGSEDAHTLIEDVWVSNTKENGIWIADDSREVRLENVLVSDALKAGFRIGGTDHKIIQCTAEDCGTDGFLIDYSGNTQLTNCKAFDCGLTGEDGQGFNVEGADRVQLVNCQSQDNRHHGFVIYVTNDGLFVACQADSNSKHYAGFCGFRIDDSNGNVIVGCSAFDKSSPKKQEYGIQVTNTCYNNTITNNNLLGNKDGAMSISSTALANNVVNYNMGFVTENSGTATNSTATTFVFNHGLAGTPTGVWASFNSTEITGWTWTATSTQITITVVGMTADRTCYWMAEYNKP